MDRTLTAATVMNSKDMDPDITLVERYVNGDMKAFDELMIRYERQIYRLCYRFTSNADDARDLAQDVFIKAFEHLGNFRRESSLKTWLYRIATNHCINHVKSNGQQFVEVTDSIRQTHSTAHGELEDKERREHFRLMVKRLPPKQRAILELRIHEQLSYEEIGLVRARTAEGELARSSNVSALEKFPTSSF